MESQKVILVCPLNWGLGHAARVIPLIKSHVAKGDKVIVASSGASFAFLKSEFPDLIFEKFKGINIQYFKKPLFLLGILMQMPLFLLQIIYELFRTKTLVKKWKVDQVISDNRYGCRFNACLNVLVTHQLFIKLPKGLNGIEPVIHWFTRLLIERFDECWVPDFASLNGSLSGELSHASVLPDNVKYIGPLSRLELAKVSLPKIPAFDVLAIVSGPEPHRSMYEAFLTEKFRSTSLKVIMVCGRPQHNNIKELSFDVFEESSLVKFHHLPTSELALCIQNAKEIYARIGYSSLMDLYPLNKEIHWSPTPGQTEQEYLFEWHKQVKD